VLAGSVVASGAIAVVVWILCNRRHNLLISEPTPATLSYLEDIRLETISDNASEVVILPVCLFIIDTGVHI
jgi:hypothetical protein